MRTLGALVAAVTLAAACHGAPEPRPIASRLAAPPRADALAAIGVHVPPRQHDAWTAGPALQPELATAVATLFDQGLADPRGLEYREVDLVVAAAEGSEAERVTTHAWVFEGDRFAVAWSGVTYPVARRGDIVDARADAARLRDAPTTPTLIGSEADAVGLDHVTPLKIALLARLGEDAIAAALWKARAAGDPYLPLARAWTYALFDRAAAAYARGDRTIALAMARATAVAVAAVTREADRRRLLAPYFEGLEALPRLIDEAQRVRPVRPPMPDAAALAAMPEPARLRLLVERLDEIRMVPSHFQGWTDPTFLPALLAIGTPAIDALLPVLESDPRLTRTVSRSRGAHHLAMYGVEEAAYAAVRNILNRSFPSSIGGTRADRAAEIRAYWDAWRNVTLEERWYRQLADDKADRHEQVMSALEMTQPATNPQHRLRGDPLRAHAAPSVTALLVKRVDGTADASDACYFAQALHRWEPAASLAPMTRLQARLISESGTTDRHGSSISDLAKLRAVAGDPTGLDSYAQWLAGVIPDANYHTPLMYSALSVQPARPAVVRALDAMFRPGSPWLPLADPTGRHADLSELLHENLLDHPAVNRDTLAALADRRAFAAFDMPEPLRYRVKPNHHGGGLESVVDAAAPHVPPQGTRHTVRVADWTAYRLVTYRTNVPRFELYWSEPRRDAALASLAVWVRSQLRP